jgi:uncharacterized damage-inducible protein DinB
MAGVVRVNAQNSVVEELRKEWAINRMQAFRVAEPMPADKYEYRPGPKDRSFGGLITHMIGQNMTWMEAVAGDPDSGFEKRVAQLKSKVEILKAMTEYFDYGSKVLANLTDQKALETIPSVGRRTAPRWVIIAQAIRHGAEHYGNLDAYLQLNGIDRRGKEK